MSAAAPVVRVLVSVLVVVAAGLSMLGDQPWSGPVLATLDSDHGLHLGDLVAVGLGLAVIAVVWVLPRTRR